MNTPLINAYLLAISALLNECKVEIEKAKDPVHGLHDEASAALEFIQAAEESVDAAIVEIA